MMFEMEEEEKDDSGPEYSDSEADSDIWPDSRITKKEKKPSSNKMQSVENEILAARKSRGWHDFVNTGSNTFGITDEDRSKRVRRMLMVGQAIDAFEDVPV